MKRFNVKLSLEPQTEFIGCRYIIIEVFSLNESTAGYEAIEILDDIIVDDVNIDVVDVVEIKE